MRRRVYSDDLDADSLINLTPLIDVVFVVLITFILIAPLLKVDPIDLSYATKEKKSPSSLQSKEAICISVYEDNTIIINERVIKESELSAVLTSLKKNYPQEVPKLIHDKKAAFGTYQTIKNALEMAGFEKLDVILKP